MSLRPARNTPPTPSQTHPIIPDSPFLKSPPPPQDHFFQNINHPNNHTFARSPLWKYEINDVFAAPTLQRDEPIQLTLEPSKSFKFEDPRVRFFQDEIFEKGMKDHAIFYTIAAYEAAKKDPKRSLITPQQHYDSYKKLENWVENGGVSPWEDPTFRSIVEKSFGLVEIIAAPQSTVAQLGLALGPSVTGVLMDFAAQQDPTKEATQKFADDFTAAFKADVYSNPQKYEDAAANFMRDYYASGPNGIVAKGMEPLIKKWDLSYHPDAPVYHQLLKEIGISTPENKLTKEDLDQALKSFGKKQKDFVDFILKGYHDIAEKNLPAEKLKQYEALMAQQGVAAALDFLLSQVSDEEKINILTMQVEQGVIPAKALPEFAKKYNIDPQKIIPKDPKAEFLKQQQEVQNKIAAYQGIVSVLTTILGFSNPKLARQMNIVGSNILQMASVLNSFDKFQALGTFSKIKVSTDLLSLGLSIFSAFFGGPSADELILQKLGALRKDIQQLREEIFQGFSALDAKLNQLMALTEQGINEIIRLNHENLDVSYQILKTVESVRYQLEQFASAFVQQATQVDRDFIDAQKRLSTGNISAGAFEEIFRTFDNWIAINSFPLRHTSPKENSTKPIVTDDITTAFLREGNADIASNDFYFLIQLATQNFGLNFQFDTNKIPVPAMWAAGISGLSHLVRAHREIAQDYFRLPYEDLPDNLKRTLGKSAYSYKYGNYDSRKLAAFQQAGRDLLEFLKQMAEKYETPKKQTPPGPNEINLFLHAGRSEKAQKNGLAFFYQVYTYYHQKLAEFLQQLHENAYKVVSADNTPFLIQGAKNSGFDIYKDATQDINFYPLAAGNAKPKNSDFNFEISLDQVRHQENFKKLVPTEFRNAVAAGLGKIVYEWQPGDISINNNRNAYKKYTITVEADTPLALTNELGNYKITQYMPPPESTKPYQSKFEFDFPTGKTDDDFSRVLSDAHSPIPFKEVGRNREELSEQWGSFRIRLQGSLEMYDKNEDHIKYRFYDAMVSTGREFSILNTTSDWKNDRWRDEARHDELPKNFAPASARLDETAVAQEDEAIKSVVNQHIKNMRAQILERFVSHYFRSDSTLSITSTESELVNRAKALHAAKIMLRTYLQTVFADAIKNDVELNRLINSTSGLPEPASFSPTFESPYVDAFIGNNWHTLHNNVQTAFPMSSDAKKVKAELRDYDVFDRTSFAMQAALQRMFTSKDKMYTMSVPKPVAEAIYSLSQIRACYPSFDAQKKAGGAKTIELDVKADLEKEKEKKTNPYCPSK